MLQPENHTITGHHHNGHIPNGPLHKNGENGQGHLMAPKGATTNGHHPHLGHQNHGYQHTPENGNIINGFNNSQQNGINGNPSGAQLNGQYHHMNGQHNHGNGAIIHLNGLPKISPNPRIMTVDGHTTILQGNGTPSNGVHLTNGHSPMSNSSVPVNEANNANERRQEEQKKDDRWGNLKKGLKYNHFKGIISGKFGKNDSKDDKNGNHGIKASQGTNTQITKLPSRENSPSKREKNTNIDFQNGSNRNTNTNFQQSVIETNLSTPSAMLDSPSKHVPEGLVHGAQFRNSVVHFDLPSSTSAIQQRGGSTRVQNNPIQNDGLAGRRSGSFQQLSHQQQQQQQQLSGPISQQQLWRQQQQQQLSQQQQKPLHYSADNLSGALPSDQTYGNNGRPGQNTGTDLMFI